jgi:phosphoribosylpyrophosphate synthetase
VDKGPDLDGLLEGYGEHVTVVDVAPTFATAIKNIHNNESVSSLFQ